MLFSQKQITIITNKSEKIRETTYMKRCPQCNTVFSDDTAFCGNDGTVLIAETFALPSESGFEEPTQIRREPIVVDLSNKTGAPNDVSYRQTAPPVEDVIVQVPAKNNTAKYALFLLVGLLIGGTLVLATLLLTKKSASDNAGNNVNAVSTTVSEPTKTPKKSDSLFSANVAPANQTETASDVHAARTGEDDAEFNGRVISLNAYVRSSPNRNAPESDILPIGDRITITARNDPNGLWFHVVCEHGASGWMHGNTIEYTR